MTKLTFQEKTNKLEVAINQKNIPQEDKQLLLKDLEELKQTLAEHQQKKLKKHRDSFISYPEK